MKPSGIMILIAGLLIAFLSTYSFISTEKANQTSELEISINKEQTLPFSPLIGVIIMAVGASIFVLGSEKKAIIEKVSQNSFFIISSKVEK
jgi:hypothetical protein